MDGPAAPAADVGAVVNLAEFQPSAYHQPLCARCGHDHASSPCPHWTTTGKARP